MKYSEFRETYKNLLKYAPEVSSLYTDKPKEEITAVIKHFKKMVLAGLKQKAKKKRSILFFIVTQ